jgi:hypothetical protein
MDPLDPLISRLVSFEQDIDTDEVEDLIREISRAMPRDTGSGLLARFRSASRSSNSPIYSSAVVAIYKLGSVVVPVNGNSNDHHYAMGTPVLVCSCDERDEEEGGEFQAMRPNLSIGDDLPDSDDARGTIRLATSSEIAQFYTSMVRQALPLLGAKRVRFMCSLSDIMAQYTMHAHQIDMDVWETVQAEVAREIPVIMSGLLEIKTTVAKVVKSTVKKPRSRLGEIV